MDFIDACLLISFELKWWSRSLKFVFIACAWAVFQTIFPMAISFNLYTIAFILQRSRYTTCGAITFFLLYLFGCVFFFHFLVVPFLVLMIICSFFDTLACKFDLYEMIFVTIWLLLCRSFRPRTGFDKSSLERLEQLFRKTVGNEKEIRREDFKKIVTSKNVRCFPIVLYFSHTCEDN